MKSNHINGKLHGVWTSWYENGQKNREILHRDNDLISSKCWDNNGNKIKF